MSLPFLFLIIGLFTAALLIIRLWLNKIESNAKTSDELIAWMKDLGARVESSTLQVDHKLTRNMELFNNRLDSAAQIMGQVQKSIGEFSEIGRSMKDLQDLLQSPKLRGNIGEQILKELLGQYLPADSYHLQHIFKSGEKVDAVIKTTQGYIPIDSKFPIDNFRRLLKAQTKEEKERFKKEFRNDVKKHILDIARKYILVDEGTYDYALMYIPSEAIYYEIICDTDLFECAADKRVLPVSPVSFYAYMKAILMSFEGQRIQSQAKEILSLLKAIQKDYEKSHEALTTLGRHITNSHNQLQDVGKLFASLGQKIHSSNRLSPIAKQEKLIE
ncbi:DNA recombination protein RmuC [Candidatus Roizmanbacteria bacterium]|nr:DNA recombination protein RmuC [Candidatus Roizmanbacteria bacterium]